MRAGRASSARHRLARPTPIRNGPQVVPVPGMPTCILLRTAERAVMLAVDSIAHRVPCVCTGGLEYQPGEMVWAKVAPRRSPMTIVQGHRRRCLCSPRRRRTSTGSVAFATVATVAAVAANPPARRPASPPMPLPPCPSETTATYGDHRLRQCKTILVLRSGLFFRWFERVPHTLWGCTMHIGLWAVWGA